MIKRIVKLSIEPKHEEAFLKLYEKHLTGIKKFPMCKELHLMEDINNQGIFFTYSTWESEEQLNYYRSSEYFEELWSRVKPLFSQKAEAWSLNIIE